MSLETPWNRARKLRSTKQEQRLNKLPGGRQHPGSGRFWRFKRDGVIGDFLIEARTNEKSDVKSYRIQKEEFLHIQREALSTPPGLLPAMQIDIQDLSLMVIRLSDFQDMYNRVIELEARFEEENS